jgi:clathrin heavy chain
VHIIDTSQGFKVDKRDMKADSILMHKERNVIAVRAAQGDTATVVQVFDMDATKKITQVQINDSAQFWRWISTDKLAVVGKNSIWHIEATQ